MQRINSWGVRAPGDIFFFAGAATLSRLIIKAETLLNPVTPAHLWVPSHAGMVGPGTDQVTEAWINLAPPESSAAMVNPAVKYQGAMEAGLLQVWRPIGGATQKYQPVMRIVARLGPHPYGILALGGFEIELIEELVLEHAADNPVKHAMVCSMTVLEYLVWLGTEPWATALAPKIQDYSPDLLLRAVEANAA